MPHIPRRYPSTTAPAPENEVPPVVAGHTPRPQEQAQPVKPARQRLGIGRISLHEHRVDVADVCRVLFGKEPEIDEHTGQLDLVRPGDAAGTAGQ